MDYYEKLLKIQHIKDAMLDKESELLFTAKIDYMITRDSDRFYSVSDQIVKDGYCKELDDVTRKNGGKGIVIFGSGHDGIRTKKVLESCHYFPVFFCDSNRNKVGCKIEGLEVISVDELLQKRNDYLVVLGSSKYAKEMFRFLSERKFPAENIVYPQWEGIIYAQYGRQYFDVFDASEKEVFIDCGGYDGDTLIDFINWTNKTYEKAIVFEPATEMYQHITERIAKDNIANVELYNNALWNKKENLHFLEIDSGSRIAKSGVFTVEGVSLDEVVTDDRITFIKMDVEGSELNALKGAQNIIKKYKPKLAICIYHRSEDILDIPIYIQELVPEYKFYIRHYSSNMWETVLYAKILDDKIEE